MRGPVLIDSGPLLALLSPEDSQHPRLASLSSEIPLPLLTCWPVITEVAWLLQRHGERPEYTLQLIEVGSVAPVDILPEDWEPIRLLLARYADLKLQLADACLLQLADRLKLETIITFDQRDFRVAKTPGGRLLQIVPDV